MLVQMYYPNFLPPARLDQYLAQGWFRSSSMLFSTKLICLGEDVHSVVNVRLDLGEFSFKKRQRKTLKRNLQKFKVIIGRPKITAEKERLYSDHKKRFKGFVLPNLKTYLYANDSYNCIFDSYEISVYEGTKLVALSYFDLGVDSLASILGLYDENYQKFSLGIFTMLLEIRFARTRNLKYYYPGYILEGNPSFDYKLRLGNFEFYNWQGIWAPINTFDTNKFSAEILKSQIKLLTDALEQENIPYKKQLYPYFFSGYLDIHRLNLYKSPILVSLFPSRSGKKLLTIEYCMEQHLFNLSALTPSSKMRELFFDSPFMKEPKNPDAFAQDVYQYEQVFLSSPTPFPLIKKLGMLGKKKRDDLFQL